MKLFEIGTGYTPIPAKMGAATEIVVEELTKAALNVGQNVTLLDIQSDSRTEKTLPIIEVPMPKIFRRTDVHLGLMHKLKRIVYSISLTRILRRMLKKETGEVVLHFHNQYNLYFFLKLIGKKQKEKVKIAYTVHSYIWPGEWEAIQDTIKRRYFQEVYCVQNADYVLVLNDKTAEHFEERLQVQKEKIHRINNGVNTDTYSVLSAELVKKFKEEKGLLGKKIIFQAGSVCDRKNQLGAVRLLASYLKEHNEVVYMYAGGLIDEAYQKAIETFADNQDISSQVIYAGELSPGDELNKYYNAAHVTIFPSKIESFGLVIIESIAAGTAVLLKEKPLFPLTEGYAVLSEKENDGEIWRLLDSLLKKEKKEEIRREVVELYSWNTIGKQYFDIFSGR